MKKEDFLKSVKPKKSLLIIGGVIIICAFLSSLFVYNKNINQEAIKLFDVEKEDTYAKIDVELMTDYFAYEKENGYEKRLYLVMDDKYVYIASLSEDEKEKLKDIYEYSMADDTESLKEPEKVTIYGKAKNIENWQITYLKDWLNGDKKSNYTTEDLNALVGSFYLDTYDNLEDEKVLLMISLVSSIVIASIFFVSYLIKKRKYNKIMLEHGEDIGLIANAVEDGSAIVNKICKTILTDKFIISYQSGLKLIDSSDVVWIYPFEYRQRGVVTQKSVYVITRNGKTNVLATTSAWGKKNKIAYEEFYQELMNKIPNALFGYSKENREKAKELYTKKK